MPENTIPAFLLAKKSGFKYFETDVQLTRDNVLVACHDYSLKRVAGIDVRVADLTFDELKKFDVAGYFKGSEEKLPVPALNEVMDVLGRDATLCLEIKNRDDIYPLIHKKVFEFIKERIPDFDRVFVSSFDFPTLAKIRYLSSKIDIGVLCRRGETGDLIKKALEIKAFGVNIHTSDADKILIDDAHCHGLKVLVYTVNNLKLAQKLKNIGVDGIFTDRIDLHNRD